VRRRLTRTTSPATLALALALASIALAGCGGGSGKGSSSGAPGSVPVSTYLQSMCTAFDTWVTHVVDHTNSLSAQAHGAAPSAGKQLLLTFMADVIGDTDTALAALRAAGAPNISDGERIASELTAEMSQARTALATARYRAQSLPTGDTNIYSASLPVIQNALSSIGKGLRPLQSTALVSAAAGVPACQRLSG
jgi:hypothetical protein